MPMCCDVCIDWEAMISTLWTHKADIGYTDCRGERVKLFNPVFVSDHFAQKFDSIFQNL